MTERSHHQLLADLKAAIEDHGGYPSQDRMATCLAGLSYAYGSLRLSFAAEAILKREDLVALAQSLMEREPSCGLAIGYAGHELNRLARELAAEAS